eukprot:359539-Chlamydomonas_euryale.AAC.2
MLRVATRPTMPHLAHTKSARHTSRVPKSTCLRLCGPWHRYRHSFLQRGRMGMHGVFQSLCLAVCMPHWGAAPLGSGPTGGRPHWEAAPLGSSPTGGRPHGGAAPRGGGLPAQQKAKQL